jgi:hypothetical protein
MNPYLKNNKSKKGWRHDSSGRVLTQQAMCLEFKIPKPQRKYKEIPTNI